MLIESIIVMIITSIFITTLSFFGISYTHKLSHQNQILTLYNQLHAMRMEAQATNTEKIITPATPGFSSLQFTPSRLGFTENGSTKYAGTITLSTPPFMSSVSLVVGYGHVTLKL